MNEQLSAAQLTDDFPLYAQSCLKIVNKKAALVPLELNQAQWRVQEAIERAQKKKRPVLIVELKSRQLGLSTDAEARLFHMCHMKPNRVATVVAHRIDSARNVFRMSRRFYDNLPSNVKPEVNYLTRQEIEFSHNMSRFQIEVASDAGGRSFTGHALHFSEFAFFPNPAQTLKAAMQVVAENHDSLVIVESTPNGLNDFYDLYVEAKTGQNDFVPIFLPWFEDANYRTTPDFGWEDIDDEEKQLAEKYDLDLDQLAWRRWCIRNKLKGDRQAFLVEYPSDDLTCFLTSGRRIFERESLEYYNSFVPPNVSPDTLPAASEIQWDEERQLPQILTPVADGRLVIYKPPNGRHSYIAGADPSEGDAGSDPSPIVVFDQMAFEVAAVWHGRMRPDLLAHVMRSLCIYYLEALAVWEANNHGLAFQIEFEKIYSHFYTRDVTPDSIARRTGEKAGYMTSAKSRSTLFHTLRRFINDRMGMVHDPRLTAELGYIFYNDKNQAQHEDGKNDDLAVCLALCLEAHRGDPQNDLLPLSEDEIAFSLDELRRAEVARSMGIPYDLSRAIDRLNITAVQLEQIDEWQTNIKKRRQLSTGPLAR